MNVSQETYEHNQKLPLLELEMPVAYTMPHDWGTIRVTEAAQADHGLHPLAGQVETGDHPTLPDSLVDPRMRSDIVILGAEEFQARHPMRSYGFGLPESLAGSVMSASNTHDDGVVVELAMGGNKEEIEEIAAENAEKMAELLEVEPDDVPLEKMMSQSLIHGLAKTAYEHVNESSYGYLLEARHKAMRRSVEVPVAIGGLTVFGLGVGDTVSKSLEVHPVSYGVWTLIVGGLALRGYRRHIKNIANFELLARFDADNRARQVATDLHNTYCEEHFFKETERGLFGDEEPEGLKDL